MRYLPILLLVLILGCTGTQSTPLSAKATAVSIKSFTSDMDQVYEDGEFTLNLLVENEGAFEATDVVADLFLKGAFRQSDGQGNAKDPEGPNFWEKLPRRMRAPDIELEVPGDTYEYRWELLAPDNIGTAIQEYPFTFKVDVGYDYKSSAWAQVPLLKYSRIQQLKQSDQDIPDSKSEEFPSPISIDVNFQEPVLFKASGDPVELRVVLNHNQAGFIKADENPENKDEMGCSCCGEKLNCVDKVTLELPKTLAAPAKTLPAKKIYLHGGEMSKDIPFSLTSDPANFRYYLKADVCGESGTDAEIKVSIYSEDKASKTYIDSIEELHIPNCVNTDKELDLSKSKNWELDITEYLIENPTFYFELTEKSKNAVVIEKARIAPDCDFESDGTNLAANFVKLIDGKQAVLSCGLKITSEDGEDELYPTFSVDADYRYHVVGEESVTVIKGA